MFSVFMFFLGVIAGVFVMSALAVRNLPDVLTELTQAVCNLHRTAYNLQSAIAQLRDEWLDQQAPSSSTHKHRTTKGNNHGS